MVDDKERAEESARRLADDKARLDDLEKRADDLEKEVERPALPLDQAWKGDVA